MIRRLLPFLVLVVVLAACGGDDDASDATAAPETTLAPSTTAAAPDASAPTTTTTPEPTMTTGAPTTTEDPDAPQEIRIEVAGGEVEGPSRVEVALGSQVLLIVTADVEDEVHLHTYDLYVDVVPGLEAVIGFIADIPGIIEVELEQSGLLLTELEIR